jgi:hypothetical protein
MTADTDWLWKASSFVISIYLQNGNSINHMRGQV